LRKDNAAAPNSLPQSAVGTAFLPVVAGRIM
jgi:hypothetical protein